MNTEFELRLRDLMSGPLKTLQGTARSVFGEIDKVIGGTKRYMDDLGKGTKIRVDTSELERAHGKMGEMKTTWDVMRGTMLGEMAFRGIERGFDAAKDFIGESLQKGMEEQKTQMQLKVMKGDKPGAELYEDIHKNLLSSLYGTQLYNVGKSLTATGLGSGDVMKRIKQFEDIAGGDPGNMNQLMQTYMEAHGQGRLNLHEMLPLANMGFDPTKELTRAFGHNQIYWHKALEEPTVGLKLYEKALDLATKKGGLFFEMQKRLAKTDYGKYIIATTNIENTKAEWGEKLMPVVGSLIDALKPSLDKLPGVLERLIPSIENMGKKVVEWIEWGTTHTHEIKENTLKLWHLTEAIIALKAGGILLNTGKAFLGGLAGEGALIGGGMGVAKYAGMAAGGFEAATGIAMSTALAAVGGVAGIAYIAWDLWKETKNQNGPSIADILPGKVSGVAPGGSVASIPNSGGLLWDDPNRTWHTRDELKAMKKKGVEKSSEAMVAADDVSDSIVGGGSKQIILKFNAPIYKVEHQVFQNIKDAINDFEPKVKEALLRILYGVPGME